VLGALAFAVSAALLTAGCSEVGFPAVHDMPAPRADTTLTPDQVKQATDDLISQREHLSTEAQANGQPSPPPNAAANAAPSPAAPQQSRSATAQSGAAATTTQTAGAAPQP
jgi:hypothetical protein